jgi:hypothetical protein
MQYCSTQVRVRKLKKSNHKKSGNKKRKSKTERQYNGKKKKKNNLQNTAQKTKVRAVRTLLNSVVNTGAPEG